MSQDHPQIPNTPGIVWKLRKSGWVARWQARTDLVERGYPVKSVRLWTGQEPTPTEANYISDECQRLQTEMLIWGRGGIPQVVTLTGKVRSLIRAYQTDEDSTYKKARFASRKYYDTLCRRIDKDHGDKEVSEIKARNLLRWHEDWTKESGVSMGHALVGMLRTLVNFGATILEDDECERVASVLHRMKFKMGKPRSERLTAEQADDIRAAAKLYGHPSIGLAQAFQFECILRQKDVIGEWVPISEPGTSEVVSGHEKWLRGIRWSEIDDNLILRHTTSKRLKDIEVDLKMAPMVMEELSKISRPLPSSGPIIVNETTGLPWTAAEFRRQWRFVADLCGIPKTVRNMDSRAGAISEATDAGAELEHVRHAATHGDIAMTQRYSRGGAEKTANVQRARMEHRNKTGT